MPVHVSDDSPGPETELAMKEIAVTYDLLHYTKNTPSLGHDRNFFRTLQLPTAEYVWYLGDSVFIRPGVLDRICRCWSPGRTSASSTKTHPDIQWSSRRRRTCTSFSIGPNLVSDIVRGDDLWA